MLPFQDRPEIRLTDYSHAKIPSYKYLTPAEVVKDLPRNSHSTVGKFGCRGTPTRIVQENFGTGGLVGKLPTEGMSPGQLKLKECLKDINACTSEVASFASSLPSIQLLARQRPAKMGHLHKFSSCAVVGNSGHMLFKKYGYFINKHQVVVRFNSMQVQRKFAPNVGTRTTIRVLNHIVSKMSCCGKKEPSARNTTLVLWHPGGQEEIAEACRRSFPVSRTYTLKRNFIMGEVAVMMALRRDAMRYGLTGFGKWRQMTSGAHGVLLMLRMCRRVSLYGFTSGYSSQAKDQYTGRKTKNPDGEWWHDFDGESYAWQVLHAAGRISICST